MAFIGKFVNFYGTRIFIKKSLAIKECLNLTVENDTEVLNVYRLQRMIPRF